MNGAYVQTCIEYNNRGKYVFNSAKKEHSGIFLGVKYTQNAHYRPSKKGSSSVQSMLRTHSINQASRDDVQIKKKLRRRRGGVRA